MADKFMYIYPMMIHKITTSVDENYWLKRLNTQFNESTNQNSVVQPSQRLRKCYYKTLGTSVINSSLSPLSLSALLAISFINIFSLLGSRTLDYFFKHDWLVQNLISTISIYKWLILFIIKGEIHKIIVYFIALSLKVPAI